jgi:hypothetical protein
MKCGGLDSISHQPPHPQPICELFPKGHPLVSYVLDFEFFPNSFLLLVRIGAGHL